MMDREFIARNQIVERYLSGRLPIKGVADFERFCRDNPDALDELGLPERVNKALRLLDAAGHPEPWDSSSNKLWQKPQVLIVLAGLVLVLLAGLALVAAQSGNRADRITILEKRATERPLEPATSTRTVRLLPSRRKVSSPAVVLGDGETQLADLKFDLSRSEFKTYRISIDRADQGRVGVLHNLLKDSNGHVRLAINTSAFGPGDYLFTIEGLNWRGEPVRDSWITISIAR